MKQVIFLCFLSLTACLAKPSDPAPANQETATVPTKVLVANVTTPNAIPNQTTPKLNGTEVKTPTTAPTPTQGAPIDNQKQNVTVPNSSNNTVVKVENATASTQTLNTSTETPLETKNVTTPGEPGNKTSTVPVTENPKHDVPKDKGVPKSDEVQHIVQARGFDGPSFIGGIILTLGLLAIGFMGFKYYRNQTERNYHTL